MAVDQWCRRHCQNQDDVAGDVEHTCYKRIVAIALWAKQLVGMLVSLLVCRRSRGRCRVTAELLPLGQVLLLSDVTGPTVEVKTSAPAPGARPLAK